MGEGHELERIRFASNRASSKKRTRTITKQNSVADGPERSTEPSNRRTQPLLAQRGLKGHIDGAEHALGVPDDFLTPFAHTRVLNERESGQAGL